MRGWRILAVGVGIERGLVCSRPSEMPAGEFPAGAGFQGGFEGDGGFDPPGAVFRRMRTAAFVVFLQAGFKVGGDPDVMP